MYGDHFYKRALERMKERDTRSERLPLRLPVPMPYWPGSESDKDHKKEEEPKQRRVVIIDMNDYSEVEV